MVRTRHQTTSMQKMRPITLGKFQVLQSWNSMLKLPAISTIQKLNEARCDTQFYISLHCFLTYRKVLYHLDSSQILWGNLLHYITTRKERMLVKTSQHNLISPTPWNNEIHLFHDDESSLWELLAESSNCSSESISYFCNNSTKDWNYYSTRFNFSLASSESQSPQTERDIT